MQKVLYLTEINTVNSYLEKEVIDYINEGQIETFESFDKFNIIAFDWYDRKDNDTTPAQLMIYLDEDDIFFFCENEIAYQKAMALFHSANTNERCLYQFFLALLKDDTGYLEALEEEITDTEDLVITGKRHDAQDEIISLRRQLLRLKRYYEQLDSIFELLNENDNRLISEENLRYFTVLESRTDKLLRSTLNLREYVTQVREAYQAQIDIEQNNLMKVFTVVTSIFLPLTLIVGWYGMNFNMPEFQWEYGYTMVIVGSICICLFAVMLFKKNKWF